MLNPDLEDAVCSRIGTYASSEEIIPGTVVSVFLRPGTKGRTSITTKTMNETNTVENGFSNEFVAAQNNLAIANGLSVAQMTAQPYVSLKTQNFGNQGLPGQVALPIMQTAFGANGSNAALPASSGFGNTSFVTDLQQGLVGTLASTLAQHQQLQQAATIAVWWARTSPPVRPKATRQKRPTR